MIFLDASERDALALRVISTYVQLELKRGSVAATQEADLDDLRGAIRLRYLRRRHLFESCRGSFSGFVWTLCKSESVSRYRYRTATRRDWRRTVTFDPNSDEHSDAVGTTCFGVAVERRLDLDLALRRLSERDVQLVSLVLDGYSVTEAGGRLGIGRSTAYRRFARALSVLQTGANRAETDCTEIAF